MRQLTKWTLLIFSFLLTSQLYAMTENIAPIGFWQTIDDITGKPKAIIQISAAADKTLYGRILKIYPGPGKDQNELCTACEGEKRNKRIVGMVILENLKQNKKNIQVWEEGNILDPKNGKTYHCSLRMTDNGQKLHVRGYIGLPLFGRSQTWIKVVNTN